MFNRTIFKQTFKSNFKIWLIITLVMCIFNMVLIAVFDAGTIASVTSMIEDTPLSALLENTTFLGMLAQTFYTLQGVLLSLVFVIITADSLVVSHVDRGSMAYLLSTPTKRSVVVRTQALYFILSLAVMFSFTAIAGLVSVQVFQGGVWEKKYTVDIEAVSDSLDIDESELSNDLSFILQDEKALEVGAASREIDTDVYSAYLNIKMTNNAYEAAAEIMGNSVDDISRNLSLIKDDSKALQAAAEVMGMDGETYEVYLDQVIKANTAANELQDRIYAGLAAAAEVLGMEENELAADMGKLKNSREALTAAVDASGIPEDKFVSIINSQLAAQEIAADQGIDFSIHDYLMLNLGLFLLMFATSGISFMFSCIFNLSKNYMAFGAGIPFAFYVLKLMAETSDDLDKFKYFSMNSLFDTTKILNYEGYFVQFIALAVIGIALYEIGMRVFKEKDLPL